MAINISNGKTYSLSSLFSKKDISDNHIITQTNETKINEVQSAWEKDNIIDIINNTKNDKRNDDKFIARHIFNNTVTYSNDSITYIINIIRKNIINKATGEINISHLKDKQCLERFQEKYKQIKIKWDELTLYIIDKMNILDKRYKDANYFGLKDMIINTIADVLMSYIILDETKQQDLPYTYGKRNSICEIDKNSMEFKIKNFIDTLLNKFEIIEQLNIEMNNVNILYSEYLNTSQKKKLEIEHIENNIKQLKKDNKTQDTTLNKEINNNETLLLEKNNELNNINEKLNKIVEITNKTTKNIDKVKSEIFKIIDFNYFMHDDWCPQLDDIIPKN